MKNHLINQPTNPSLTSRDHFMRGGGGNARQRRGVGGGMTGPWRPAPPRRRRPSCRSRSPRRTSSPISHLGVSPRRTGGEKLRHGATCLLLLTVWNLAQCPRLDSVITISRHIIHQCPSWRHQGLAATANPATGKPVPPHPKLS